MSDEAHRVAYLGPALSGRTTSMECAARSLGGTVHRIASHGSHLLEVAIRKGPFRLLAPHSPVVLRAATGAQYLPDLYRALTAWADAFVFVMDSQMLCADRVEEWRRAQAEYFAEAGRPWPPVGVFQYNKRDLPDIRSIHALQAEVNLHGQPFVGSVATRGIGVLEALRLALAGQGAGVVERPHDNEMKLTSGPGSGEHEAAARHHAPGCSVRSQLVSAFYRPQGAARAVVGRGQDRSRAAETTGSP